MSFDADIPDYDLPEPPKLSLAERMAPPRKLTSEEIVDITSIIPTVKAASKEIAASNRKQIMSAVELQLTEIKLKPCQIPTLKALIYNRCARSAVQPGDTAGLQASEAIGQPVTQSVLNSFHSSGAADVGANGLQIFQELLNLTKQRKMPIAEIHLLDHDMSYREARSLATAFEAASIKSLLVDPQLGIEFHSRSHEEAPPTFYRRFEAYAKAVNPEFNMPSAPVPQSSVNFVRLRLSKYRLVESRITTADVASTIEEAGGVVCVYSPSYEGIVDVFGDVNSRDKIDIHFKGVPAKAIVPDAKEEMADADLARMVRRSAKKASDELEGKGAAGGGGAIELALEAVAKVERAAVARAATMQRKGAVKFTSKAAPFTGRGDATVARDTREKITAIRQARAEEVIAANETAAEIDITQTADRVKAISGDDGVMVDVISPEQAVVLFLQTCIVPRIANETFVVASTQAQIALSKLIPDGRVVPPISRVVSLFRRVNVNTQETLKISRGATRHNDFVWHVWLNEPATYATAIPRDKLKRLFENAYPEADVEWVTIRNACAVEITFPEEKNENPADEVAAMISDAKTKYVNISRKAIDDSRSGKAMEFAERPRVLVDGQYNSFVGKNNFVPCLQRILCHPSVDGRYTTTNNFHETASVMGIEIARSMIFKELHAVIDMTGAVINPRHIQMIVDPMTVSGTLMSFTARASVRQNFGAYSDSSFEQALAAFRRSAISGAPEPVTSTSTATLVGSLIQLGTGSFKIVRSGGYEPPPYARDTEADVIARGKATAVQDAVPPPQFVESGSRVEPSDLYVNAGRDFGSMTFPPSDADANLGMLSLREVLENS